MSENNFRNPKVELLSKGELEELQAERLNRQLRYVYTFSGFYRKKFNDAGITPDDIKNKDDLKKLPLTTAAEIHHEKEKTGDPYGGLLCIPGIKVVAVSAPSEFPSLGQQLPEHPFFTAESLTDINQLTNLITRHWVMLGVKPGWVVAAGANVPASIGAFTYSILPEACWPLSGVTGELILPFCHLIPRQIVLQWCWT